MKSREVESKIKIIKTMIFDLIKKYRQSINPPYSRKDALTILVTIVILLAIPLTAFAIKTIQDLRSKAQTSPPPAGFSVESERQVCSLLGPDAIASQITGQDGSTSIKVGSKSFWTFGDTTMVGGGMIPNNIASATDSDAADCINLVHKKDFQGKAAPLLLKAAGELTVWPDGMAAVQTGYVHFFYISVISDGAGSWKVKGIGLAKFDTINMNSIRAAGGNLFWTGDGGQGVWGATTTTDSSYLYVFLSVGSGFRLARAPLSQTDVENIANYRYWNGSSWVSDFNQSVDLWVQPTGANGISVRYNNYLGKWLAVYTSGYLTLVNARTADSPTGPWSEEVTLVNCANYQTGPGYLCYTGQQHNEFEKADGQIIYVTYANTNTYRVYLHEVKLAKTPVCTRANPTVELSPASQSGTAGSSLNYTFTITNNDSVACGSSTFSLAGVVPSGWSSTFTPTSLTLAPGASGSSTFRVTSSTSASVDSYPVTATATNSSATSYAASASAVYQVTSTKPGDIDTDGDVDIFDLSTLISRWGTSDAAADINDDGTVDIFDLSILLSNWGT